MENNQFLKDMKKTIFRLMALAIIGAATTGFIACGDDNDDSSSSNGTEGTEQKDPGKVLSSPEQKQYLEKVANDFMGLMPASDFKQMADLARYVEKTYVDKYKWNDVEDWAKNCFDVAVKLVGQRVQRDSSGYHSEYGKYDYLTNHYYNEYQGMLIAANFCSHFTAEGGRWTRTNADDLQFIFNDQNGQQCVLRLATSGNVVFVNCPKVKNSKSDWYNYLQGDVYKYVSTYNHDSYYITVGIPERIEATLTQGGQTLVKTTVSINLSGVNNNEFNTLASSLTLNTLTELNNGYSFNVSQVAYSANKASVDFTMTKNGSAMITLAASSDISGLPSCNLSAFERADDVVSKNSNATNGYAKVDILGKVQLQGSIKNVRQFVNYIVDANDNKYDEAQFKSYVNQANSVIDLNIFYDNTAALQGTVKLEPFKKQAEWSGSKDKWRAEPVIYFGDGSSYSTFSAFFNEKDFQQVIDSFKALANQYANLMDKRISW